MLAKLTGLLIGVLGLLALAVGLSALFAWPVQLLWNYLSPNELFHISFKQAWALSLLCNLLFKSSK